MQERVFSERMLPKLCTKCAQPAEHGREWLLFGPLPKAAQCLLKLIPILVVGFVAALVVALLVAPEAAAAVVGLGGPLGLILGLLVAQGVFRRSRNVLTVYLCPEHLPEFERLVKRRRWAKGLMVAITVLVVIVGSQLMIYTWFGRRSVSLLLQVAVFGGVPGLLAAGIAGYRLAVARVTTYLGLDAHLSGDETKLFVACQNPRFAANIAEVHATPSIGLEARTQ